MEGTLHFTPNEGVTLDLTGSFMDIKDAMSHSNWEIILGFTVTGKEVTLLHCQSFGISLHMPGLPTSKVYAKIVFIGKHFLTMSQIIFNDISIRYSLIDKWLNLSGFTLELFNAEKKVIITYQLPKPIESMIDEELSILILFNVMLPLSITTQSEIIQTSEFQIKPNEPKKFIFFQNYNQYLQNLLSLATQKKVYPISIRGVAHGKEIDIFYKNTSYCSEEEKIESSYDLLFRYDHVDDRFGEFLRRWFDISKLFEPVLSLYFGTIYNSGMYLEYKFLTLCQAIEAYHRRISDGVYQEKDSFTREIYPLLIKAIPDNIDKHYRDSIKSRLKYLNEFSLRKRLKEIIERHNAVLLKLISNPTSIISTIVDTRNLFTHYDGEYQPQSIDIEKLYLMSERIKFILEVCFLHHLGFKDSEIILIIDETQKYDYLRRKKAEV